MGVRFCAAKRGVGRLKGSRGAINRTISVVDLFHRTDRSIWLVGLRLHLNLVLVRLGAPWRRAVKSRINLTL
jgi:hypothetical protein